MRAQSDINPATGRPFSTELPDCRAYELVSTGDKQDNDLNQPPINGFDTYGWAAANGGSALWMTYDYAYADPSNGFGNVFQSTRETGSWLQSPALAPPGSAPTWIAPVAASGDLSTVVLARFDELENLGGLAELVEREADGSYSTIATGLPNGGSGPRADIQLSEDGRRAFLQTTVQLAGDTHGSGEQLYEWTRRDGLRVFAVDGSGEPTSSCGGAVLAGSSAGSPGGARSRDISRDGSRVAFLSPAPPVVSSTSSEFCGPSDLYVRENESTTIDISKPPSGVTDYGASYVGMSGDGAKVFFITRSQLTPEKTGTDSDLFEYDLSRGTLTRLSVGPPGYDDAIVQSAMASADGSHVYFEAYGQLVPGAGGVFSPAQSNAELANLYVYADGTVTFVATVNNLWQDGSGFHNFGNGLESIGGLNHLSAQVTPDGADLLFSAASEMTAYDNRGNTEMYRYDTPSATISCVTCNPLGVPPGGSPPLTAANTPGLTFASAEQLPAMSEDGGTVFFASPDRLVGAATNTLDTEANRIYDVYEWHDAVLSLLSSGTSPRSDYILGASANGSNVFFVTRDELVPQDGDGAEDLYDARVEGGSPAPSPPAPCVSIDTCRSVAATPPTPVTPASVSVADPGNLTTVTESQSPPSRAEPKAASRSERLTKAVKACGHKRKSERPRCEAAARKRFGAKRSTSTAVQRSKRGKSGR